jgi:hypothetical protein
LGLSGRPDELSGAVRGQGKQVAVSAVGGDLAGTQVDLERLDGL